jgi:acyl-coenzyme A synthetase/AMP-(fatty) acid ligase
MGASLLFLDPASGEQATYEDLLAGLRAPVVRHAPWVKPRSPGEAVVALLRAVLLRQALTLLDSDLSARESEELGGTEAALAERIEVPGVGFASVSEMLARARPAPGFRLTLFTSGSTGRPKRVSHDLEGLTRALRVKPGHAGKVWGLAYNPTHIAGVQVALQAFFNGNPLIHLFQTPASGMRASFVGHGVTHVAGTPSFFRQLLVEETPLTGLEAVTLGGERSDATLLARLAAVFPRARLRNLYAMTEAGTILEADGDLFVIPERLRERVRVRASRLELHVSLLGDFERESGAGEWFSTGDLVEPAGEEGTRFRILNRESEVVNVGGHKVRPGEVEAVLLACPGVREARVFGRASSVLGELLCAEVVADASFREAEARAWLAERLQPVKVPRFIRQVSELARTRSGKLAQVPR